MRPQAKQVNKVVWALGMVFCLSALWACSDDESKAPEKDVIEDVGEDTKDIQDEDVSEDTADSADSGDVDEEVSEPPNACIPAGEGPPFKVAERADLRWKRVSALERHLLSGLDLNFSSCSELGFAGICFNLAHKVPLGGNDPVLNAMYRPIAEPGLTSALSFDRVVVALCGARTDEDHQNAIKGQAAKVFTELNFKDASVNPDDPALVDQITILYRRLLARDPLPSESAILLALAEPLDGQPITPREFAKTACFTVATTTEIILN